VTRSRLSGGGPGGDDGRSHRGQGLGRRGHEQRVAVQPEHLAQLADHGRVGRHAADQRDRGLRRPPLDHRGLVVCGHRLAQTPQHFGRLKALLLGVDHVALGEHAAPARDLGGAFGPFDNGAEILDRILEPGRLLIQKGAGAGGTIAVGAVVEDTQGPAAGIGGQSKVLAGLAANLEHRSDVRVEQVEGSGDGLELVARGYAEGLCHQGAARAGEHNPGNAVGPDPFKQLLEQLAGDLERPAAGPPVPGDQDRRSRLLCPGQQLQALAPARLPADQGRPLFREQQSSLNTDRAHVNTKMDGHRSY